jgi:hypothetical protein
MGDEDLVVVELVVEAWGPEPLVFQTEVLQEVPRERHSTGQNSTVSGGQVELGKVLRRYLSSGSNGGNTGKSPPLLLCCWIVCSGTAAERLFPPDNDERGPLLDLEL